MKKVFSGYKYLEWCLECNKSEKHILNQLYNEWPSKCEGLTQEEMCLIGYLSSETWMEEVSE